MTKSPLIVLTGPTASGKSSLALQLAREFKGEIVSADSRTVYRGMDVATAKPTRQEQASVPHHLIDIVNPDQEFTLPDFLEKAATAITTIQQRGNLALLVGGTVLYINALLEGWQVPVVAPDLELRQHLESEAARRGSEALFRDLVNLDPPAAERINPFNVRRVVRALEVYYTTGLRFSQVQSKAGPAYQVLKLGLTLPREDLYRRADQRIENMFENGLVEEVRRLVAAGYAPELPSMSSVGYQQVLAYLDGKFSLKEAKDRMRFATHRYIRHQYTWFRRDPAIIWLEVEKDGLEEQAAAAIKQFLENEK